MVSHPPRVAGRAPVPARRFAAALALLGVLHPVSTPAQPLPEPGVRVELLVMGAGDELYTRFGHAALLVRRADDPGASRGVVYNFGYSDFGRPGLIPDFLRGRAPFWVATQPYARTVRDYRDEDRTITRQALLLTAAEHARLAAALRRVALPENRAYIYHHFDDNCSSRLRDLIDEVTGGAVRAHLGDETVPVTLRELVRQGFSGHPGLLLLSELLLGRRLDRPLSAWEAMFLPRYLSDILRRVPGRSGSGHLAGPPRVVYRRKGPPPLRGATDHGVGLLWGGVVAFAVLGAAGVAGVRRRSGALCALGLGLPALLTGVAGTLIWGLAMFSTVPELRANEWLLLLWPTDLLVVAVALRCLARGPSPSPTLHAIVQLKVAALALVTLGHLASALYQEPRVVLLLVATQTAGYLAHLRHRPRRGATSMWSPASK